MLGYAILFGVLFWPFILIVVLVDSIMFNNDLCGMIKRRFKIEIEIEEEI